MRPVFLAGIRWSWGKGVALTPPRHQWNKKLIGKASYAPGLLSWLFSVEHRTFRRTISPIVVHLRIAFFHGNSAKPFNGQFVAVLYPYA
ncbi:MULTISPECIES: hypothetical protein [Acidobacteriaceae]|uniref:hypothetical protein n=1 Tax=Acidobacteriaceae TaxID=204434 RepID=UPI00131EBFA2|nr:MULTISPECIES: hypothetical protein [Acidobacteriaceae]MDW5265920.1 hypothetical protein [Edaphobacter sp.]